MASSEDRPAVPGCAHLTPRHRTNPSGAYSEWMAQVVTRVLYIWHHNDHFLPCNVRPTCGTPLPRHSQELKSREYICLLGTCFIGVALGVRVYSQTPVGVHQAFQNAHGPQNNTAPNRHPTRQGITIRIKAASTRTHIKVEGFGDTELCYITALWHWCVS
ncbi:hypothetical protein EDB85DRAFT_1374602 [Lactarius pseudohatsudake]|nr:hypothetical protein EDB85DRAFT_1374602 [Lactarius pseudohatsudake]